MCLWNRKQRLNDTVSCLELISDNVIIGLSGTMHMGGGLVRFPPPKNPVSKGNSEIFYYDVRESKKQITSHTIKEYRGTRVYEEFQTLSCNKMNKNQFVVGCYHDAKIFDIRQMKEPVFNFGADCSRRSLRRRDLGTRKLRPRRFNVSWSPSGKYIFIHAPFHEQCRNYENISGEEVAFFWDVQNAKRVDLLVDPEMLSGWASERWNRGVHSWVNDNLLMGPLSKIVAVDPEAKTIDRLNDFVPECDADHMDDDYMPFSGVAFNHKTQQLAGSNGRQIFIWSHYKLPPYPSTRLFPTDDSDIDD